MEMKLEISQKQVIRLSKEMKLSFEILSIPYLQLIKFWNNQFGNSGCGVDKIFLENIPQEKNFYNYLEEQLVYFNISKKMKENLIYCINNLNSSGFLELSDLEICQQLKINKHELKEVYKYLYELEPLGVGTHNFIECIKLQLIKKGLWEDKMAIFLENLSYIVEKRELDLSKKIGVPLKKINDYLLRVKSCNPKPTRGFSVQKILKIIPDFYLYIRNSKIVIEENKILNNTTFMNKSWNNIELLNYCIEKRINTLRKILEYIVEKQKDYFLKGSHLNTLHEEEIAKYLNLNISTISRAVQNKYIWTERGIISFKSLLCYSDSRDKIKEKLQIILEKEDKRKPYSDLQLAKNIEKLLKFSIARRTITKYRVELGYPCSRKRK